MYNILLWGGLTLWIVILFYVINTIPLTIVGFIIYVVYVIGLSWYYDNNRID